MTDSLPLFFVRSKEVTGQAARMHSLNWTPAVRLCVNWTPAVRLCVNWTPAVRLCVNWTPAVRLCVKFLLRCFVLAEVCLKWSMILTPYKREFSAVHKSLQESVRVICVQRRPRSNSADAQSDLNIPCSLAGLFNLRSYRRTNVLVYLVTW